MSAIFGMLRRDGRAVKPDALEAMAVSLAHRAADTSGVWQHDSVGLGARLLWTTPESRHETLPLIADSAELVITADARIDNRDELISLFGTDGRPREEIADSELILKAYQYWKEDCPRHLLGDFAFAIWDARKQLLFCARDHFGIRPFYYYRSDDIFAFGTEIKALLTLKEVPRRLNEEQMAYFLTGTPEDPNATHYQEIFRLLPAQQATISRDGMRAARYWSLDPQQELRGSDEELAQRLREIFLDAVRARLRSAYPVGAMLSGGLDSSSIVSAADLILNGEPLHTFSVTFEALRCDEQPYIDAVVKSKHVVPHYVSGLASGPLSYPDDVLSHLDEPETANMFLHRAMWTAAQGEAARVVLDGFDVDSAISHGYGYIPELLSRGRVIAAIRESVGLATSFEVSPWRPLWQLAILPRTPELIRRLRRRMRGDRPPPGHVALNQAFATRLNLAQRSREQFRIREKWKLSSRGEHWAGLDRIGFAQSMEIADLAAAPLAIRPAYPFFDQRLMEFCLALPGDQKLSGGWTRVVMRRAMQGILPDEIRLRRGKSDLSPGHAEALMRHDRTALQQAVMDEPGRIEPFMNVPLLRETYERFLTTPSPAAALTLWQAGALDLWLRHTRFDTAI